MDLNHNHSQTASLPASPISSSDSETCNTATSRVHFGPLRSPEKRFFTSGHLQQSPQPALLNFPRQQAPQEVMPDAPLHVYDAVHRPDNNRDSSDENQEEDDPSRSRSVTPENVRFPPDEPSSILATRIIRAHDNPSPPPRMGERLHVLPPSPPSPIPVVAQRPEFLLPPESPSPSPSPFFWNQEAALPALFRDSINLSPSPRRDLGLVDLRDDLTAFDFSEAAAFTPQSKLLPVAGSSALSQQQLGDQSHAISADDLLTGASVKFFNTGTSPGTTSTATRSDEENKTNTWHIDAQTVPSSQDKSHDAASSSFSSLEPFAQDGRRSQSPVRRSPRPRRSLSPYVVNRGNTTLDMNVSTPVSKRPHGLLAVPSPARTQRKKHRERGVSPASASDLDSDNGSRNGSVAEDDETKSGGPVIPETTRDSAHLREQESPKRKGKRRDINGNEIDSKTSDESPLRRQLGSLSPSSACVLTQLVPSASPSPTTKADVRTAETERIDPESTRPLILSFPPPPTRQDSLNQAFQEVSGSLTPNRSGSPVRSTSPIRSSPRRSPVKFQPMDLDDPNRTPARRIPLEQAVAQGQISLQKAMQLASRPPDHPSVSQALFPQRTSVFSFRSDMQSPARRIPVSEATPVKSRGPKSPIRAPKKERSKSVEPNLVQKTSNKPARSTSVDYPKPPWMPAGNEKLLSQPQTFPPVSNSAPQHQLPYPLAPIRERPIPEDPEPQPSGSGTSINMDPVTVARISPVKSNLKQVSSVSRIPRIGMKPYTKPASIAASTTSNKAKEARTPGIMRKVDLALNMSAGTIPGPLRLAPMSNGIGDNIHRSDTAHVVLSSGVAERPTLASSGRNFAGTSTSPLKRKRTPEIITSPMKVTASRVLQASAKQPDSRYPSSSTRDSPVKKMVFLRRVVDLQNDATGDKAEDARLATAIRRDKLGDSEGPVTTDRYPNDNDDSKKMSTSHPTETHPPVEADGARTSLPPTAADQVHSPHLDSFAPSITSNLDQDQDSNRIRRTTRPRKAVTSNGHVHVFESAERPRQRRRAAFTSFRETDVFSGMSAVALRAITSSNTTKNQAYWATRLETEVIRKEGVRPESPTVKVKTTIQRQEEERARQRQERAERRARRSDDGFDFSNVGGILCNGDMTMADVDSDLDERDDYTLLKHQLAPGDEVHETPSRTSRPTKRPRPGEEDFTEEKKKVKWDHALSTAVFVDDVRPRTRARPREDIIVKGCLAKTAKAVRLDNLGNLANADTPLTDLVHENIVVKKFVYDNDPEPEPDPVLVPKNTRSRSKKAKN